MYEEIIKRLQRYSKQCITDKLDPDFAEANEEAIEILKTIKADTFQVSRTEYDKMVRALLIVEYFRDFFTMLKEVVEDG